MEKVVFFKRLNEKSYVNWKFVIFFTAIYCAVVVNPVIAGWRQDQKLAPSDPEDWGKFGISVAIDGNTVIIGAEGTEYAGENIGSAYIFTFDGNDWSQQATLLPADTTDDGAFGNSVAIDGNVVVAGDPEDDVYGTSSGSAYAFRFEGSSWIQKTKLIPPSGNNYDWFGDDVDIDGDVIVVGAWAADHNGIASGTATVFRFNGSNWLYEATLTASDAFSGQYFGESVAVDQNVIVVGAEHDNENGDQAGAAYVFEFDGSSWNQTQKLLPDDGYRYRSFGNSADIYGDTIVIGSDRDEPSGSAYVFVREASQWTQMQKLQPNDGTENSHFAGSVALHKNRIIVGQYWEAYAYGAHIFMRHNNEWIREAVVTPNDVTAWKHFGISVGICGGTAIVGADWDDDIINNAGSAYIFNFIFLADLDKNGIVNFEDFSILSNQWCQPPGNPSADIAPDNGGDGIVYILDLDIFVQYWLWR